MATRDDIETQRRLLDILRETMQVLLREHAIHGGEPPIHIVLQIKDTQRKIQETKTWLVAQGEAVDDEAVDGHERYIIAASMMLPGKKNNFPYFYLLVTFLLAPLYFLFLLISWPYIRPTPHSVVSITPVATAHTSYSMVLTPLATAEGATPDLTRLPTPLQALATAEGVTPQPILPTPAFQELANQKYNELATGISAFNPPTDMEIGQTIIVRYRLGYGTVTTSTLQAGLGSAAAPQIFAGDQVKINSQMQATLTGEKDAFNIISISEDAERLVVANVANEWAWQVTAKQGGPHQLTLQLVALIEVGDKDYRYPFPVETRNVTVNINWLRQTQSFIGNNWQGLLVWLVPAGAAVAMLGQQIRQRKDQRPRVVTTQPTPKRTAPNDQTVVVPPRVVTPEEAAAVTNDDIRDQYTLLKAHRRRLAVYVRQRASLGTAFVLPGVEAGIDEARADIQQVKAILRSWGETVADMPDDDED